MTAWSIKLKHKDNSFTWLTGENLTPEQVKQEMESFLRQEVEQVRILSKAH